MAKAAKKQPKKARQTTVKAVTKTKVATPLVDPDTGRRRLRHPTYSRFKLQKRIRHPVRLPSAWHITKQAAITLWKNKKLFIGIAAIYGVLNLILVQSLANGGDISSVKSDISDAVGGGLGKLAGSAGAFVQLVGTAGNGSSQTAGAYQLFLLLFTSLAAIWALRQTSGGVAVRIRDSFYRGMYPLVPFMLVLIVIGLQLLPMIIGTAIYELVITNNIAVNGLEQMLWALLAAILALVSLYFVASSLIALYIVTLPDMTPLKALRSARELVRYRRWTVLRKVLFLPIVLLVVAAVVMLPIILVITPAAKWLFFILTTFTLAAIHGYMYTLYLELLHE